MSLTLSWNRVVDFDALNRQMEELMITLRRFSPVGHLALFQDNVAASQTNATLGIGQGAVDDYVMDRTGHVIGVAVYTNDARTAGTLNIYPTIDGTALTQTAQLDGTNATAHNSRVPTDLNSAFEAGARIGAEITTDGSWAPTTADIIITVLVQFSMED